VLRIKDLRELTGVPLPLMPDGRRGHPSADAVHSALMERRAAPGEPPDLDELARGIEQTWQTWQAPSAFRYDAVGQQLPELIRQVQMALSRLHGNERRRALRLASTLYQLTRTWTKRVGEHELSLLAADRAVSCALDADDPDLSGAAAWSLAMILSAQGKTEQSRAVVQRAIEEAHRLLDVATSVAAKTGETNHFRMVFGPTNVALHRVSTAAELGRTVEALQLAEHVAHIRRSSGAAAPDLPPRRRAMLRAQKE
jgi:hypothetical protein